MDDDAPDFGVGFEIDTTGSIAALAGLDAAIDRTTAAAINDLARVEQASKGVLNLGGATADLSTFGGTAKRELDQVVRDFRALSREKAATERQTETMIRALEREAATIGKTKDEVRALRIEQLALASVEMGNTDGADRLLAAVRAQRAAVENLAETKELAASRAAIAASAEEQAIRDAAFAYGRFNTVAREKMAIFRDQEAADARLHREAEAVRERANAEAAVNAQLLERSRIDAGLTRNTGVGRASAVDNGATYSALAARAQEEHEQALRSASHAFDQFNLRVRQGVAEMAAEAEAARAAANAQAVQAASLESMRNAVDPLRSSQQRLARELENAARLYHTGAIGQEEYQRSSTLLATRLDEVQRAQARAAQGITEANREAGLGASDLTNIMFQVQDIVVSLAGGQNPFLVMIQQGSQLGGIMAQTGTGIGGMARAIGGMLIVSKPTAAALAAVAAAQATVATATTAASTAGARAAIASAELAVAEQAAATAGTSDAAAQARLAMAQAEQAATAEVAAAANRQLAAAQLGAGNAATAASAGAVRSLAPWLAALLPIAAAAGVAFVAFDRWKDQVNDDAALKKYAQSLGLTRQEMKQLKDVSVDAGDMLGGIWDTLQQRMGTEVSGKKLIDWLFSPNDAQMVGNFVAEIYGLFVGGYKGIVATWGLLPAALGDVLVQAVNATAGAIEAMVNKSIGAINSLARGANTLLGTDLFGQIDTVAIARMENQYAGAGKKAAVAFGDNVRAETKKAMGAMTHFASDAATAAQRRARATVDKRAREIIADRTPKTDKHAEQLAREAEAVEAQIRNLYKLADAYGVSGAAALVAEARVKAESAAIKKRGDIEAMVERQIRLAIAQRVSDGAKATATMRDQAIAQEQVNAMVAGGLVPAERAAELVRDRIADLPLLAALEVAQQRGLVDEAKRATAALEDQRKVRDRAAVATRTDQFNASQAAGKNRLAELAEELRLIGATDAVRVRSLATLKATQEADAKFTDPAQRQKHIDQQVEIADGQQSIADAQARYNDALAFTADRWDLIARNIQAAGSGLSDAFGEAGRAIGDLATIYAGYEATRERGELQHREDLRKAGTDQEAIARANTRFALASSTAEIGAMGDAAAAAKGLFDVKSKGYARLAVAEKAFRAVEFAMSARAMVQDVLETGSKIASSAARTAASATEAVVKAIASLPFPANLAAGAATVAALAAIGVSIAGGFGGGGKKPEASNSGTGTVLGDAEAKSESIKRAIDTLREVDTVTSVYSRQMADSLRSIDGRIGGVAAQIVRGGDIGAGGVTEGFKANTIGSILGATMPVIGGLLKSLFGSTTKITGSGLYGGDQSVGSILAGGFDASVFTDVEKTKKFFGIKTGTSYSTQFGAADPAMEKQFGLLIRSFSDAITAAAGPLGQTADDVAARVNGITVSLGKIDTKGLTGAQIEEKLAAVFGAAADNMAAAAIPGIERFQKVGEGAFETLIRVASTVEAVTTSLDRLGAGAIGVEPKLDLAARFDSIGDLTSAADAYLTSFFTREEQAAASQAQLARVFASIGMVLPTTLSGFRNLVEAQDLTTEAGRATYATLLQLAPAFADLQSAMMGAKSAADVVAERQDLERKLLELGGDTAALRALDLAKLDASNRGLQQQVWAVEDAQAAAKAAEDLRDAWKSVGDTLLDEVKRIRGLTDADAGGGFSILMGQFYAATSAARGGDMDAAKTLPALSQALLKAAEDQATSRQELLRVQAQTAASLEATSGIVGAIAARATGSSATGSATIAAAATAAQASPTSAASDDSADELRALREEIAGMRRDNNAGHAATAGNTGRAARVLEAVTSASGGDAVSVAA